MSLTQSKLEYNAIERVLLAMQKPSGSWSKIHKYKSSTFAYKIKALKAYPNS